MDVIAERKIDTLIRIFNVFGPQSPGCDQDLNLLDSSESALRKSEEGFFYSGLEIFSSHSGVMMVNLSNTLIFLSHNFKNSKELWSVLI